MSAFHKAKEEGFLQALKDSDNISWCSGAVSWPSATLPLFYKTRGVGVGKNSETGQNTEAEVKCVDLLAATTGELESLSAACGPATFGLNQEDVLDEAYRKAGKLDLDNFALNLSPELLGFNGIIKKALLIPSGRAIEFERYKINVYGEGSFFKPHKDTPRSQSMFGSLVIVFPTPHEGGALLVSHNNRPESATIDFSGILKNTPSGSIAFAVFYSDVNHEVSIVTSGYRVSLTYNLYYVYDDDSDIEDDLNSIVYTPTNPSYDHAYSNLRASISKWLQDPRFFTEGGVFGFRLAYEYAIPNEATIWYERAGAKHPSGVGGKPLEPLKKFLKGSDAVIYNVCAHLGLTAVLKFVYSKPDYDDEGVTHFLSDYGLEADSNDQTNENEVWETIEDNCLKIDDDNFTWLRAEGFEGFDEE